MVQGKARKTTQKHNSKLTEGTSTIVIISQAAHFLTVQSILREWLKI